MKLHLPKALVAALTAVYAAALPLATTVGTGALLATAAAYTAKAAEHTDVSGNKDYTNGDTYTLSGDTTFTGIPSGGAAATVNANEHNVTLQAKEESTQVENFVILENVGNLSLSQGRYMINETGDFSGVTGNINICGAQVWFTGVNYTGDNKITQGMTIEGGTFAEGNSLASLNYSALRIGRDVEISGLLTIGAPRETRPAKISFQGGHSLTLSGGISGSHDLLLGVYNDDNTLAVTGATTTFSGILEFQKFRQGSLTVTAGSKNGLHVGGIAGDNGALGLVSGSTTAVLTLDVKENQSLSFAGTIANGYSIVKTGAGTQTFSNTTNSLSGNISVDGGTLVYGGTLLNTDSITLTGSSTLTLGGTVNITNLINNDAGTLVLKDGVVLKGIGGDAKSVDAGQEFIWTGVTESVLTQLVTNAAHVTMEGAIARDFSDVIFQDGSTLVIEDGQTVASAPNIATGASITLKVEAGHTGTWRAAAQPGSTNGRVSTVEIGAGGTLIAYQGATSQFCTFNQPITIAGVTEKDAGFEIRLAATPEGGSATILETYGSIFGWDNHDKPDERTVTMGKGSQWLLHAVVDSNGNKGDIWFNHTTTVLDHAQFIIDAGATVAIERYTSTFRTETTSAGQSTISGGTIKLKAQSDTKLVFDVARSAALEESSTADLVVSSVITGATKNDIEKTGNGILELTANNTFTNDINVNGGTLRLAGEGGKAGTGAGTTPANTITVASGATLELAHTADCDITNNIILDGNLVLSSNVRETLSGSITGTLQHVTLSNGATLGLSGSGASMSIGFSKLTMGENSGFYLANNASLTLGGNDDRIDKMAFHVGVDGTGELHLNMLGSWTWDTHKVIVLDEGSRVGGVHIDSGCLAMSSSAYFDNNPEAASTDLRGADLHLANGANLVVTKKDGGDGNMGTVYLAGTTQLYAYGAVDAFTFSNDFTKEGAGTAVLEKTDGGAITLAGNVSLDQVKLTNGTLNLGGTIRLKDGFVINGGAVNVTQTATIDLTDWRVSLNSDGNYEYHIGAGVNVHTNTSWSLGGGTYNQTSGLYTVECNHTVTNNHDFRWGSADARDDNGQAIPADSLVCFAGNTSINMAAGVSVQHMGIAEGAEATYTANGQTLSVKGKLLLNGSLSLLDAEGGFDNGNGGSIQFVVGTNGKLIADWGGKTDGEVTSAHRKTDHTLLAGYHGDLIVKNGASCLTSGDRTFHSVTVESGGQFGINGTHNGDITISGNGTKAISGIQQDYLGALKFSKSDGDGSVLNGDVYVRGGSAAISSWGGEKGKITGAVIGEDGHSTITIRNGDSDTNSNNVIKVSGGLRGISVADVQQGTLQLLGGGNDTGTISDFGDTFTKRGAGTLTIAKNGAVNGGHFVVAEGTVSLGSTGGTAILNRTEVTVRGGAALILEHDALGWSSGNITKALTLQGESETKRALLHNKDNGNNTLQTVINMNGHSRIENARGSTGKVNTLSGFRLNATGTDNEIATEIQVRWGFVIDISNMTGDSELTVSGKISTHSEGYGGLTKTGGGTLILTNTGNDVSREIAIHGGTLKLAGAGVKHGSGTLNMSKDANVEVAAGDGGSTTLSNSITGRGNLIVSSGTLTLNGSNAVSLDNIYVLAGAAMTIDGTKTIDSATGTGGVNVMGTIYSDGVLTVNGAVIMESTDHLAGDNFSDGANGRYVGGEVKVVQGTTDNTSKPDRLGGTGTITIGSDTFNVGSIAEAGGSDVTANNFTWHHSTGILTYLDSKSASDTHDDNAYYINVGIVTYGAEGNTAATDTNATKLILDGGTLKITSAAPLQKDVEALSDSTLYIDEEAEVNRSSIKAGRNHVRLAGTGTYTISDEHSAAAPTVEVNMEGDWRGWVKLRNVAANQLDLNNYGPRIELSGLFKDRVDSANGYLKTGTTDFTSDIRLTASDNDGAALYLRNGNTDDCHTFSGKISGKGDIVRDASPGTHKTLKFTGDVSDWKGKFTSSHDSDTATTTLEFRDGATEIYAGVEATSNSIVNVTIHNDLDVVCGDSQDTEDKSGKIAINQTAGGTLTTNGLGNKDFYGNVAAKKLVTSGGRATFAKGATFDTTSLKNRNGGTGTVRSVTIDGTQVTGAGADLETLGELVSLDVGFAAASINVRDVTMHDVTLTTSGTVSYGDNVKAVAATTGEVAAPALYAATPSDTPATLTAMAVQSGGTASGTLTIDVTSELLRESFGKDLKWTFLDGVTLASDFKVELGDILAGIVSDGLPKVYLTVVNGDSEVSTPLTSGSAGNINNITTATGGLLAGTTGPVNVTLTIENVPEPTTGTLSVLALAALAARRRRRK